MKVPPWLLAPLINVTYRLWCSTLRITEKGRHEGVDALQAAGKPMVIALWHDEFFALMHVRRTLKLSTIVSQSNDGEYLARLLEALGLKVGRGSSSRGGLKALLYVARLMRDERYVGVVTVDGPRGPRHQVKDGAVFLSMRTPAHIIPTRLFMERAKIFRSWDRFQLPLPFSRVHIVFDQPYLPDSTEITDENVSREREKLQAKLEEMMREY